MFINFGPGAKFHAFSWCSYIDILLSLSFPGSFVCLGPGPLWEQHLVEKGILDPGLFFITFSISLLLCLWVFFCKYSLLWYNIHEPKSMSRLNINKNRIIFISFWSTNIKGIFMIVSVWYINSVLTFTMWSEVSVGVHGT